MASICEMLITFSAERDWMTVGTLDLWSRGRWIDSRPGRCQVVTIWTDDCLSTGKPPGYIANHKVNSAFHPSG